MSAEVRVGRWQDTLPGTYDPDQAVVITDPPYGLASAGGGPETEKGYEDTTPWGRHVEEVLALLPAKRHAIRGPATMLIRRDHPAPRRVCVEMAQYRRRAANRPGVVPFLWQGWAIYGRLKIEHHRRPATGDALTSATMLQRDLRGHKRTSKSHKALTPFAVATWIVDTWADPGMLVIDPFAGLGTIGLAARTLGFDYLGSEVDPEYAAIAIEAFATERLTMGLAG